VAAKVKNRRVNPARPALFSTSDSYVSVFPEKFGCGAGHGLETCGSGVETGGAPSRSDCRGPVFHRDGPRFNPDLTRTSSPPSSDDLTRTFSPPPSVLHPFSTSKKSSSQLLTAGSKFISIVRRVRMVSAGDNMIYTGSGL
jgi:hypothetical protein